MKRKGNLYHQICSVANLVLADERAREGKAMQPGVIAHNKKRGCNILKLHNALMDKTYKTSAYYTFKIYEPKERIISALPFFPDRIVQQAILNILESVFYSVFTADSYSCIKRKGIHGPKGADKALKKALRDVPGTQYYLKLDIKKFYPTIDHAILKQLLRRKFKDKDLLWLLDEIIDSAKGMPIGSYTSQFFANFYLTGFDRWIREQYRVKYYFRYSDDILILADSKPYLHQLRADIMEYMGFELNLQIKRNYRVAPVSCGIDYLGYVYRHTHTLLRPRIKKRMFKNRHKPASLASYIGLLSHCNGIHLTKKVYEKI